MCPTSVLNTRTLEWQNLKRKWVKLGIQSENGRNSTTGNTKDMTNLAVKNGAWSASSNQTGN